MYGDVLRNQFSHLDLYGRGDYSDRHPKLQQCHVCHIRQLYRDLLVGGNFAGDRCYDANRDPLQPNRDHSLVRNFVGRLHLCQSAERGYQLHRDPVSSAADHGDRTITGSHVRVLCAARLCVGGPGRALSAQSAISSSSRLNIGLKGLRAAAAKALCRARSGFCHGKLWDDGELLQLFSDKRLATPYYRRYRLSAQFDDIAFVTGLS